MPVPATIDVCQKYLFADVSEMVADGIPELIQKRLIRLRDMYNLWLQFPRKKDLEIVGELERRYMIGKSAAYEDVRIIKRLLGDLNKTTKDYHRFKFCQMIEETYEMAKRIKDARAMAQAPAKAATKVARSSAQRKEYNLLRNHLSNFFGTKVQFSCDDKGKGKISIPFKNEEELERIVGLLDKLK